MPSPTIGRLEPSTASLISALSIGVLCFPRAVFSTGTVAWRKTRCRPGSATSSRLTFRLRSSRNIKPHSSAPASTKTQMQTPDPARVILDVERIDVVADRGYFKIEDIEACEKAGLTCGTRHVKMRLGVHHLRTRRPPRAARNKGLLFW